MFKAEGKQKRDKLRMYVASKNLPFKVSVVTGPSGSYREADILAFLEKWCEPWVERATKRQWDMFLLDG